MPRSFQKSGTAPIYVQNTSSPATLSDPIQIVYASVSTILPALDLLPTLTLPPLPSKNAPNIPDNLHLLK